MKTQTEPEIMSSYALVTGASKGLGKAFAVSLAQRGYNLILISLPGENLSGFSQKLQRTYAIHILFKEIDLSVDGSTVNVYDWVKGQGVPVTVLINNAGFGCVGDFEAYEHEFYEKMIKINSLVTVLLTRMFIEDMKKQEKAYILNLGSIASFFPMPYKVVYAATKNFTYSFSRALKEELRNTPVSVSILCPGPVVTNREVALRTIALGRIGKLSAMSAKSVAEISIHQLFRGKGLIIPGFISKLYYWLDKVLPVSLKQRLIATLFRPR